MESFQNGTNHDFDRKVDRCDFPNLFQAFLCQHWRRHMQASGSEPHVAKITCWTL